MIAAIVPFRPGFRPSIPLAPLRSAKGGFLAALRNDMVRAKGDSLRV